MSKAQFNWVLFSKLSLMQKPNRDAMNRDKYF